MTENHNPRAFDVIDCFLRGVFPSHFSSYCRNWTTRVNALAWCLVDMENSMEKSSLYRSHFIVTLGRMDHLVEKKETIQAIFCIIYIPVLHGTRNHPLHILNGKEECWGSCLTNNRSTLLSAWNPFLLELLVVSAPFGLTVFPLSPSELVPLGNY